MPPVTEPTCATPVQNKRNKQININTENNAHHGRPKTVHSDRLAGFKHERTANDHIPTQPPTTMTTVSALSSCSNISQMKLDCSSYENLAQDNHHKDHLRSLKHDVAMTGLTGNQNRAGNFRLTSTSNSGKDLDDSGTEADDEGRVGPMFERKDGHRRMSRRSKELSIRGDGSATWPQSGSARTDNEFLRVAIEAGILVGIYFLSYRSSAIWEENYWHQKACLLCHGCINLILFLNYLLRYSLFYLLSLFSDESGRYQIIVKYLPSFHDSASALYPSLLPVVVTLSLMPNFGDVLVANCVLGLSALPVELLHSFLYSSSSSLWFSSVSLHILDQCHWLLSITPLIVFQYLGGARSPKFFSVTSFSSSNTHLPIEYLTLLYPFHRSLISILHYLTSSSLLPAERQLLSISLINLYNFSESPPTVILKAVIWIGGFGILLTCRHVIRLKRFSSQSLTGRARQKRNKVKVNSGFWKSLAELLRKAVGHHEKDVAATHYNESDADEDEIHELSDYKDDDSKTLRANSNGEYMLPHANAKAATDSVNVLGYRVPFEGDKMESKSKGSSVRSQEKEALTADHGEWLYLYGIIKSNEGFHAAYVYTMIFAIIFWPFRLYISNRALHGYEAVGWIIGYLIRDIPILRDWVRSSPLRSWIPVSSSSSQLLSAVDQAQLVPLVKPGNFRLLFICYWLFILYAGLRLVLDLPSTAAVDTRRKLFHGMMVLILVPTIPVDPTFISLALSVVLAIFLLLEFLRISGLPPLSKPLAVFLTPYVDGRDMSGPIVISHIFLLLGCAIPVWLSLASAIPVDVLTTGDGSITISPWQDWNLRPSLSASSTGTDMLSGVICVGLGDAAASLVGRRYGRKKWPWSSGCKSLEGSTAFAVALFTGLVFVKVWLYFLGWGSKYSMEGSSTWLWGRFSVRFVTVVLKMAAASCMASLTEAVLTGGNDNIIVPVVLWAVVRGLEL